MTSTVDYEDLTRPVSDYFTKPFPAGGLVKIGTETKAECTTVKTTSERKFVKGAQAYDTTIEPKFEFKDYKLTVEGKLQTSNVLSLTATRADLVKGLKVKVGGERKANAQTVNLGFEYSADKVFLKLNGGLPIESRAVPITGNVVVQPLDKVFLGAKFDFGYNPKDSSLSKNVEFKVSGSSGAINGFVTANLDKKIGILTNYKLSDDDSAGLRVGVELPKTVPVEGKPTSSPLKLDFDLAGQHRVCKSSVLAGKLNIVPGQGETSTGIRFGLGYVHTFPGTNSVATLGADVSVSGLLGKTGHPDHSLGFELKLK